MRPRNLLSCLLLNARLFCGWSDAASIGAASAAPAPEGAAAPAPAGFSLLAPDNTGLRFTNRLSETEIAENQIRLNGSGVALGDVDGDGWCDVYLCGSRDGGALFRNLGHWQFTNVTAAAQVACTNQYSTGAVFADVDGDGDLDLLVNSIGGGSRLFLNDGQGRFAESLASGLQRRYCATTATLADVDGDGDLDLYVGNYRTTTVRSTGMEFLRIGGRRILRPEDRDDYELLPDGRLLEHGEPDCLYLNDGQGHFAATSWTDGRFRDEDGRPLLAPPRDWTLSAMFRDLNGDGAPDLYVCGDFQSPDRIWINDGRGRFQALPRLALRQTCTFTMGVDFADLDRDGFDDLFASDMIDPDHQRRLREFGGADVVPLVIGHFEDRPQSLRNTLQRNRGDGTYAEIAYFAGLDASGWTWSPLFLDVDLDGYEDLVVTTGHSYDTQDLDADERIAALGPFPRDKVGRKVLLYPRLALPKKAYRNRGNLTFTDASDAWGFNQVGVAQGLAAADLDNDGDLDLVVNHLNDAAGLYRSDCTAPRLAVRLRGQAPNTQGIGARIQVEGGPVAQSQEAITGGHYLSGSDPLRVFAAGTLTHRLSLVVTWRNGNRTRLENTAPNQTVTVREPPSENTRTVAPDSPPTHPPPTVGQGTPAATLAPAEGAAKAALPAPWFVDATRLIAHTHHEDPLDDFSTQPLLPNRLSQLGPGLAWCDLNGDGWEDLVIASGKGGRLAAFQNDGRGGFAPQRQAPFDQPAARDQTTVLALATRQGSPALLVGSANFENGLTNAPAVLRYDLASARITGEPPGSAASTGPMTLGDYDGDGHLDLFVGGRVVSRRYPEPAASLLLHGKAGQFVPDQTNSAQLAAVGLVSGAVFSDLDGDGWPELILACEWGPIRIYRNAHGVLTEWDPPVQWAQPGQTDPAGVPGSVGTSPKSSQSSPSNAPPAAGDPPPSTLHQLLGWWNGVTTGDFDGDGRLDIAASNWGWNTRYRASPTQPRQIYFGDFDRSGTVDLIEAYVEAGTGRALPDRDFLSLCQGIPFLRDRFPTHEAYSRATVSDLLGEHFPGAARLEANTLASLVLLNRGDHFVARALPAEAQWAPAFALCVGDLDGDGAEDLFLSQNFFATQPLTSRADAGRGLALRGDGHGGFTPLSAQASGIQVYGEQRGAALADYDQDGRTDLAVTQNGAATRLFHNAGARPGLRVRLRGPEGNPTAVGAALRLGFGSRRGPAREIQAGGGYWSQDSAVPVLAMPEPPTVLWARWPGGRETEVPVTAGARELTVELPKEVPARP